MFVLTSSADPDEMLHYATFHLGLYCLPTYAFMSHKYTNGWKYTSDRVSVILYLPKAYYSRALDFIFFKISSLLRILRSLKC